MSRTLAASAKTGNIRVNPDRNRKNIEEPTNRASKMQIACTPRVVGYSAWEPTTNHSESKGVRCREVFHRPWCECIRQVGDSTMRHTPCGVRPALSQGGGEVIVASARNATEPNCSSWLEVQVVKVI